jgi:uncharacterized membrane protein
MRRLHILLFILIVTLAVLIPLALIAYYFSVTAPSYYDSSWMSQMWGPHLGTSSNYGMGGMMGGGDSGTVTTSYLWIIPVMLIGVVASAIIGIGFYLYLPELRYIKPKDACTPTSTAQRNVIPKTETSPVASAAVSNAPNSCDVLLKTMTPEEQKVINVLIKHKGKYLQKYVTKEAGLSRLKIHRIIARFAKRGIVTVKEFGNTNEIALSDWVIGSTDKNPDV